MNFRKPIFIILFIWCAASLAAVAQNGIIINLKVAENPWADSHLEEKLDLLLSTVNRVSIIKGADSQDSPIETAHIEDLITYGQNLGGRFLIDVFINRIDIEKKKYAIFPGIASRYQIFGKAVGKIRIIDIDKSRVIELIDIDCSLKEKDRWQFLDDDPFDADLKISADRKIILFDELENEVASNIFKEVIKLSKGNHFGK